MTDKTLVERLEIYRAALAADQRMASSSIAALMTETLARIEELEAENIRLHDIIESSGPDEMAHRLATLEKVRERVHDLIKQGRYQAADMELEAIAACDDLRQPSPLEVHDDAYNSNSTAPTFIGCKFTGPPPNGFSDWHEWASHPPYRMVSIAACEDKDND